MAQVKIKDSRDFEGKLGQFIHLVQKEGIIRHCKQRQTFISNTEKRRTQNWRSGQRKRKNIGQ